MSIQIQETLPFEPTYEQYRRVLAILENTHNPRITASFEEQAFGLPTPLIKFLESIKDLAEELVEEAKIGWTELCSALAHRSIFDLLKAIKFNVHLLMKGIDGLTKLFPLGLHALMDELVKTSIFKSLQAGTITIDAFLEDHPVVKKLAGPVLAAFLFWIWLNMAFVGNIDTDFDMTSIGLALVGSYSVSDLFTSKEGMVSLALLATGMMGFSVPWLGTRLFNVLAGLAYTGAKHAGKSQVAQKLKGLLELKKV